VGREKVFRPRILGKFGDDVFGDARRGGIRPSFAALRFFEVENSGRDFVTVLGTPDFDSESSAARLTPESRLRFQAIQVGF